MTFLESFKLPKQKTKTQINDKKNKTGNRN